MNKIVRFSNRFGFENGLVLSIGWVETLFKACNYILGLITTFCKINILNIDYISFLWTAYEIHSLAVFTHSKDKHEENMVFLEIPTKFSVVNKLHN